jgi:cbb3-type cytochrome oxidase subunit 3
VSGLEMVQTGVMLALLAVFLGLLAWLFRPGAREEARRDAAIPFRGDDGTDAA